MLQKLKRSKYVAHETKFSLVKKFLIVLTIFLIYLIIMLFKFGIGNGILVSILTWSFFVLGTPIADAGILLDLPIRLITNIRMIYSEILVWAIAISLNITQLIFNPEIYTKIKILSLLKFILTHPYPFWLIIIISAIGTYLSIYFGDELLDVIKHQHRHKYHKHKNKYLFVIFTFFFVLVLLYIYSILIRRLGLSFSSIL